MANICKSRPSLLVIEDNPMICKMYDMLLTRRGCTVQCAASTAQVIDVLDQGFVPDAIISDYCLGGDDTGLAALHVLFARLGRKVPTVIITGEDGIAAGGLPVLRKPVLPQQLEEVVTEMLDRSVVPLEMSVGG